MNLSNPKSDFVDVNGIRRATKSCPERVEGNTTSSDHL